MCGASLQHSNVSFQRQADSGKWSKPNSSLKRPHSELDPSPGSHSLWPVSSVLRVHGIYRKQTATDGFLKIKCWLSATDNLPRVRSWQQEMVNKHSGLRERGRHMHTEAWGHNQCNHHASNAASISRLMDSINKRPLVLYRRVQHVLLQCHQYNIDLIIPHPCSAGLEPEIPLLFIP